MIYLDYNATTPLDPRVFEAMKPFFFERFGNAASRQHAMGIDAADAVEKARGQVAAALGADPREIVFTSGATESNNLALKGALRPDARAVSVVTEHRSVLDPLERRGSRVTWLSVAPDGTLDPDRLARAVSDSTALVSAMHANNETGVLHPLREIGALCKARGVLFHTDATQSFGKEPIDVEAMGIDLLSASAHKICGPKGVGFLYVRRRNPHVRLEPLLEGGGHERGLRSGTLNVPGIVGLGAAAELARPSESRIFRALRDRLENALRSRLDGVRIHGNPERRLANTSSLGFDGVDGEELTRRLEGICVSSSSACTSARLQPSYVLGAMGLDEDRIRESVRFSLGRFTTEEEIDRTADRVVDAVATLRKTAGKEKR